MLSKEKPIYIKNFDKENAAVKSKGSIDEVISSFQEEIKKRLEKAGYSLNDNPDGAVVIEGDFIKINEGNRFLRWFIGPFGVGAAKVEIEGVIRDGEKKISDFYLKGKGRGGLYGGKGANMLNAAAKGVAKNLAKLLKNI
jgi:NAD+--asparagine ADP-ribosyltransferase